MSRRCHLSPAPPMPAANARRHMPLTPNVCLADYLIQDAF